MVLIGLFAAFAATDIAPGRSTGGGALLIGLFTLAVFLVTAGYFMLFEILWSGQTPGKRLVGVRVIRENGYPIRPIDAVIRNLVRVVDWLPGIYGVGVLTMLLNKRSKRLGDFASGTIVVREGSRGPGGVRLVSDASNNEPRGYALSNPDATLVRDFLVAARWDAPPSARRARPASGGVPGPALQSAARVDDPEAFLERLAA